MARPRIDGDLVATLALEGKYTQVEHERNLQRFTRIQSFDLSSEGRHGGGYVTTVLVLNPDLEFMGHADIGVWKFEH